MTEVMNQQQVELSETFFVKFPQHEYFPKNIPQPVMRTFNEFSETAGDHFAAEQISYPNARLHVAPIPSRIKNGVLDFIIIWGESTELPVPRQHLLPHYFGKIALRNSRSSKLREACVLDAQGFAGAVYLPRNAEEPVLRIATVRDERLYSEDYQPLTKVACDIALVDTLANMRVGRPLHFHQSVRWYAHNGYVWLHSFADDDNRLLRDFALR